MKNILYTIILSFLSCSTVIAKDLYHYTCPTRQSALACDELCKLSKPKKTVSFKVNEKNNVVHRTIDEIDANNNKILGTPFPLKGCSVVSKKDWICEDESDQKGKNHWWYIFIMRNGIYSQYGFVGGIEETDPYCAK